MVSWDFPLHGPLHEYFLYLKCSCTLHTNPHTCRSRSVHTKRWLWASGLECRGRFVNSKRELSINVVHEQLRSIIYEHGISPVDDTMAEDLIVSLRSQWSEQLSCRWMALVLRTSMSEGRDNFAIACHVRRLAFPLNISFYLMQHTPLCRFKFRILRIKKTRTKIGTLRISHTSLKLDRDIPSGSFTESDLRKIGAITDKVWWLSRAYKCSPGRGFRGFAFVCICILLSFYH